MFFSWLHRRLHHSSTARPEALTASGSYDAEAQFLRGMEFENGEGVDQDYTQAAEWYARAAEQNHSLAQYSLANLYVRGLGIKRDEAKASAWLSRAAKLGNAAAQYKLGVQQHVACRAGRINGTPERRIEAFKWVRLAAAQGYRDAQGACEFVALGMSQEEVAEGERRASDFVAQ